MPANFPSNPQTNATYTLNGVVWRYNGVYWEIISSQQINGVQFTAANSAPSSPSLGDRWLDTNVMIELVYVYDGTSYQWVQLTSQAPSGANRELSNLTATSIAANLIPAANITYDLGSANQRWRDLYLSGNTMYLGAAALSSTGTFVNLPAGSTVGGQSVATGTDVSTGGGPKITDLQVTSNVYAVLDDTAVDTVGGFIKLTGTNFVSGCMVYVASIPANSTTFINSTEVRAALPATAAGTYPVYVVNPDGGTAIRVPGVTFSASPSWQTASNLGDQYDGVVLNLSVVATDATSYSLLSGSLPPGLSLNANTGVITGTVTGVANDTVYSFTINAVDAELQDSPRTFTVTITVSDPYFRLTTLLLGGEQGNTVVRDSSTNNFNLTVLGDARASNFTPYGTGWSVYFDGTGDSLSGTITGGVGSSDFTLEYWVYHNTLTDWQTHFATTRGVTGFNTGSDASGDFVFYDNVGGTGGRRIEVIGAMTRNRWYHFAVVRSGTTIRGFLDGALQGTYTSSQDYSASAFYIGSLDNTQEYTNGYISNLRLVKGTALYTANFTPATTNLTAVANTSLLTCHVNSFRDASTNNFVITRNGDAAVRSFNPFNLTNTGDLGSMYFDGTGDYLSVADNDAWHFGSGNFTIEAWYYPTTTSAQQIIVAQSTAAGGGTGLGWQLMTSNDSNVYLRALVSADGSGWVFDLISSSKLQISAWNHVAFVRNGTTFQLYLNGAAATSGSTTSSSTLYNTTTPLTIGASNAPNQYVTGYVSGVHIVKGTAIYTGSTYTVPTSSLTAIANTQLLTLQYRQPHNNHGFQDSSSNNFLITRNGNASQGTFSPFSQTGWSVYFGGSPYLAFPNNAAFGFSTGNFTVEMWVNFVSFTTGTFVFDGRVSGGSGASIHGTITASGEFTCSGGIFTVGVTKTGLVTGRWYHIAVVRNGTVLEMFFDGVSAGTDSLYSTGDAGSSNPFTFGARATGLNPSTVYISNARIIKGQCLYTGTFVPSTQSLTTSSVGSTGAGSANSISGSVSLLTFQTNRFVDNGPNNFAVTITGTPSVQAFSPFAPTAVYSPAVHGGSAYFDGTGDYLTTPNVTALNLYNTTNTVECWIYLTSFGANGTIIYGTDFDGTYYTLWTISSSGFPAYGSRNGTGINSPTAIKLNEWNYIVWGRSGNSVSIWINGIRSINQTITTEDQWGTALIIIGRFYGSDRFSGYLSGLRVIKGVDVYGIANTNIVVPTAPPTAITNTQLLLNFTDAAIVDRTGRNVIESLGDIKNSSVVRKFTGPSFVSDGSGDYLLTAPTIDLEFSSGDFTIELWWYPTSTARQGIYHGSFGADWSVGIDYSSVSTNQKVGIWASSNGSSWNLINADAGGNGIGTTTLTQNSWNHIAYVRNGTTWMLFVNGNRDLNLTGISGSIVSRSTYRKAIGAWYSSGAMTQATGYLADLRITRFARYTANFTPPTGAHRLK